MEKANFIGFSVSETYPTTTPVPPGDGLGRPTPESGLSHCSAGSQKPTCQALIRVHTEIALSVSKATKAPI